MVIPRSAPNSPLMVGVAEQLAATVAVVVVGAGPVLAAPQALALARQTMLCSGVEAELLVLEQFRIMEVEVAPAEVRPIKMVETAFTAAGAVDRAAEPDLVEHRFLVAPAEPGPMPVMAHNRVEAAAAGASAGLEIAEKVEMDFFAFGLTEWHRRKIWDKQNRWQGFRRKVFG